MARAVRVGIAFAFPDAAIESFRSIPGLAIRATERTDQAAIDEVAAGDVDGLVAKALPSDRASAPSLRWLQVLSAGVETVVGVGSWPGGIVLTNARGAYAGSIAQYTIAAILRVAERMDERSAQQRLAQWPAGEGRFVGRRLRGQTLVIVGYGGIGREIGRLAHAHGMRVLAVKARPQERIDTAYRLPGTGDPEGLIPERIVRLDGLADAAAEADFLSITLPITPRTRGIVSAPVLAALRPHAWLINTGRGPVVDEAALLRLLEEGRIGGAVLDVFGEEPLPPDSPLWHLPNVVITPHVSGAEADEELEALVSENLRRFVAGEPLINQVDPERGY
ncbi:MAG TPA: D-2-hydroxyacid dehydrogenase [Candidatus Limnocylindrales bacterium]|jgi:phosphoglycerate dehydrogenase-like enzyme|nr:D-2-hydroxyacid dehydrogenase [Candidatus Limnocylindrales bacterium]